MSNLLLWILILRPCALSPFPAFPLSAAARRGLAKFVVGGFFFVEKLFRGFCPVGDAGRLNLVPVIVKLDDLVAVFYDWRSDGELAAETSLQTRVGFRWSESFECLPHLANGALRRLQDRVDVPNALVVGDDFACHHSVFKLSVFLFLLKQLTLLVGVFRQFRDRLLKSFLTKFEFRDRLFQFRFFVAFFALPDVALLGYRRRSGLMRRRRDRRRRRRRSAGW